MGVSLTVTAGALGLSASCTASGTLSGSLTWNLPDKFDFPSPSLVLKLSCKGCVDTWFGDVCKTIDLFKITCTSSGCKSKRQRAISRADARLLPLQQSLDFYSAASDSLLITGLRPVPLVAFVSVPYGPPTHATPTIITHTPPGARCRWCCGAA